MFRNIGGKIKGLAKVIFIISVIAAGFFAGFGIFILVAGVGFLVSWIGSFFMYGLGQLIEDTEINRRTNQQILAKLNAAPAAPAPAPAPKAEPMAPAAPVMPPQPQKWVCQNCGTENEESSLFCFNCGTRKA